MTQSETNERPVPQQLSYNRRSAQFQQGQRNGLKYAISWLHRRAQEMNDPHAKAILNTAAFNLGVEAKVAQIINDETKIVAG